MGGLLTAARLGAELTIVCVNNGGGGIFDFLPVAEHAAPELYGEHIATPSGVDVERIAALAGLPYTLAETPDEIGAAAFMPGLIEVRTDREANVKLHRGLFKAVDAQLG
jgi:2-succinyl-5-enolpyruvyl-6-hydroxy-3-cyclohexene-1-carboxylate synthase